MKDFYLLKQQNDKPLQQIISRGLFKRFLLNLKIKDLTYSKEHDVKLTVDKAEKVNYAVGTKYLFHLISKYHRNRIVL